MRVLSQSQPGYGGKKFDSNFIQSNVDSKYNFPNDS